MDELLVLLHYISHPPYSHLILIFLTFFLTYCRVLGKDFSWVIDDIEGIARFSEQLEVKKDEKGIVQSVKKIDDYEIGEGTSKKRVKFLSFIPELGFPGCFLRFFRLQIGKKFKIIGHNEKGHEVYGFQQSPRRHHILSMAVHFLNLTLSYFLLSHYFGRNLAFATCLLYSVHPLTTQTVAWISGINYNFSMLGCLLVLIVASNFTDYHFSIPLTILSTFFAGITLYTGCFTFPVLWVLGFKWLSFSSFVVGMFILAWKGRETKSYRTKAFAEQNMAGTTFWNWRKPIVMLKTIWYYVPSVFFPIKMGLYHTWGYHYDPPIERIDRMFWGGLLVFIFSILGFKYGGQQIQFGLTWYYSYLFIFSNFITAQQFVADRYAVIPAFGICVVLSKLLYGTPFFWILLGLYSMRTFLHLPTFKNEIDFYLSNFLNFRKSEVALGNLGASYMSQGMPGSAVDTWQLSTKVNPYYDVAWYNLYSIFKANGRFLEAKNFLENCLKGKVVHFEQRWKSELETLKIQMAHQNQPLGEVDRLYNEAKSFFDQGKFKEEEETIRKIIAMPTSNALPQILDGLKQRLSELEALKAPK